MDLQCWIKDFLDRVGAKVESWCNRVFRTECLDGIFTKMKEIGPWGVCLVQPLLNPPMTLFIVVKPTYSSSWGGRCKDFLGIFVMRRHVACNESWILVPQ